MLTSNDKEGARTKQIEDLYPGTAFFLGGALTQAARFEDSGSRLAIE
jgi:hypothetical protein